jgi:hypothetical protein
MSTKKQVVYARLDTAYRDLLVPMALVEQIVRECHLVRTTYEDGRHIITNVESIEKFSINTEDDLKAGIVQTELERDS